MVYSYHYFIKVHTLKSTVRVVTIFGLFLNIASCYKSFRGDIPNGSMVPHPCNLTNHWEAVGHVMDKGGGARNPFGEDFEKEGRKWTLKLCQKDSDGDGLTNGQELGDPDCKWDKNSSHGSLLTSNLSHPGICEPRTSSKCSSGNSAKEESLNAICKSHSFKCDALNEKDVQNVTIRLTPKMAVPANQTTYMCQVFNVENLTRPGDYHLVAVEPVLDNTDVIHHMVLFGCPVVDHKLSLEPFCCDMVPSARCQSFLSIWTIGLNGECLYPKAGIRIGPKGFTHLALQLHWNNPERKTTWTDNSGLKLYITPNKRQHDAAIFVTGRQDFSLPARKKSTVLETNCTSGCTRTKLRGPIYITSAFNHMHRAGVKMSILIKYSNSTTMYLTKDENYNYDSPQVFYYTAEPVKLEPGDELITRCEFNTLTRDSPTRWGQSTSDEMCYGFINYFPKENFTSNFCLGVGPDFMYCEPSTLRGCYELRSYGDGKNLTKTELYMDVTSMCGNVEKCNEECNRTITRHKNDDVCLKEGVFDFLMDHLWPKSDDGKKMIGVFKSCGHANYNNRLDSEERSSASIVTSLTCCNIVLLYLLYIVKLLL